MKNLSALVSAIVFCSALGGGALWLNFAERPSVSETEKRELEPRPRFSKDSYFSGEYAEKLDKYYTDTVPMRDVLVEAASAAENARGIAAAPKFYGSVNVIGGPEDETETADYRYIYEETEPYGNVPEILSSETSAVTTPRETETLTPETAIPTPVLEPVNTAADVSPASETAAPPETAAAEEEEEFNGNIKELLNNGILVNGVKMYGEDAGIMLFGGNKQQGLRYAEIINSYKQALGEDVNVYDMIVPTSAEFYLPKKYGKYSGSQKDAIEYIYSNLSEDVITVDAYSVLQRHTDEYIYFRTDHHWTDRGAYYAYTAFCDKAGIEYPDLGEYEERHKDEKFVGSLYGYTKDATLKNSPDDFYYYIPPIDFSAVAYNGKDMKYLGPTSVFHEYASGVNMYGMFLGGDNMHLVIKSGSNTGRKLVIFKESYGNALAPYFVNGFDEVYIIDIRYFGTNAVNYIKSIGATDVLFFNNAFAANTAALITDIENLYSRK